MHESSNVNISKLEPALELLRSPDKIHITEACCKFEAKFNDLQNLEKFETWKCDEVRDKGSSFCVFHDKSKSQWDDTTYQKFRARICKIISESKHGVNTRLFCIGYYFPMNFNLKRLAGLDPDSKYEFDFPIYFSYANFEGQVDFSRCTFKSTFSLSGAMFSKDVLFRQTHFYGKFYPRNTTFRGNVNFRYATFVNADFHDTLFEDKTNFHDVEFKGERTRFLDVRFLGKVNFEHAIFLGETIFRGTTFTEAKFSSNVIFKELTKFNFVIFADAEKVEFGPKDLSNISFLHTDITRVKFAEHVNWSRKDRFTVLDDRELKPEEHFLFIWDKVPDDHKERQAFMEFLKTRFGITHFERIVKANYATIKIENVRMKNDKNTYDEVELNNQTMHKLRINVDNNRTKATLRIDGKKYYDFSVKIEAYETKIYSNDYPSLDSVKSIYRDLRENYEYRLRYDDAGQLFVREMELKRKYREKFSSTEQRDILRKNNWFRRNFSFIGLYHNICNYGESSTRPLILFAIIMFFSSTFWFLSSSIEPSIKDLVTSNCGEQLYLCSVERTLSDIVGFPEKGIIIDYITRISSIVVLATLFLPFRRKFERRFRH